MPQPRRTLHSLLLALLLAAIAGPAGAWGKPGHRLVAGLADQQLRPAARAEVARLLGPEAAGGLAGVASWADELRETERDTRRWHFVSFPTGQCQYAPARECPDGNCVVGAINRQFLRLADRRRPDTERREALKFLVHFVADVHQPLHSTPVDDRGGNRFQVEVQGKGRNLHNVWDVLIIERAMQSGRLDEAAYGRRLRAQSPLPPDATRRSDRPAADWAEESCRVVRDEGIYPASHRIGDDYLDAQRARVEHRLRLAGNRLADMLNYALDPPRPAQSR